MQFLTTGVNRRDAVIHRLASAAGVQATGTWDHKSIPVIVGNCDGMAEVQIECREKEIPYVYIEHAYFQRDFKMDSYRICVSGFHCSDWRDSDREPKVKLGKWQIPAGGDKIVVIEPSLAVQKIYGELEWLDKTIEMLKNSTNRPITIKRKGVGGLRDALIDSWCAVSFGSVADVEAVLFGIPIFCSKHSPAVPVGQTDFTKIETPIYPDRAKWLRSLAAAEYSAGEEHLALDRICHLPLIRTYKPQ